jgi:uncharacterized protein YndB with AHSA1/START domain
MAPPTTETLERSVALDAPPDDVWEVMTAPGQLDQWLGDQVEIDLQPGGSGHLVDDDGTVRQVLVTAVEAGRRLAWHWWADTGELSSVEITLVPVEAGTRVDVVEVLAADAGAGEVGGLRAQSCAAAGRLGALVAGRALQAVRA